MAKVLTTKTGKKVLLLNPSEKGRKYAKELHDGAKVITGEVLTNTQKSFRSGYLKSRSDSAKAWKSNKKKEAKRNNDSGKFLGMI